MRCAILWLPQSFNRKLVGIFFNERFQTDFILNIFLRNGSTTSCNQFNYKYEKLRANFKFSYTRKKMLIFGLISVKNRKIIRGRSCRYTIFDREYCFVSSFCLVHTSHLPSTNCIEKTHGYSFSRLFFEECEEGHTSKNIGE